MGWFIDVLKNLFSGGDTKATSSTGPTNITVNVETGQNKQITMIGRRGNGCYGNRGKTKPSPKTTNPKPTLPKKLPSREHEIKRCREIKLYGQGVKGRIYARSLLKKNITGIGIEFTLENATSRKQQPTLRFRLFTQDGKQVAEETRNFSFKPKERKPGYLEVSGQSFNKLRLGTYGYEFWIDGAKLIDHNTCSFKLN